MSRNQYTQKLVEIIEAEPMTPHEFQSQSYQPGIHPALRSNLPIDNRPGYKIYHPKSFHVSWMEKGEFEQTYTTYKPITK